MASSVDKPELQDKDARLSLVKSQFIDSVTSSDEAREEALISRRYFDGHQWTDAEKRVLQQRGQPCLTDNKVKDKIETLLGFERESRRDPKAWPRNPQDDDSAEAATDAIRYVADDNQFDYIRSDVCEDMFIEGVGAIEITVDKKLPKNSKVPKVRVKQVLYDRVYWDQHSRRADFADAKYKGIVTWMDKDIALDKWSDKKAVIEAAADEVMSNTDKFDDKPVWAQNVSGRTRIQILDHHYLLKGKWNRCVFCAGGFLEEPAESEYIDDEGEPISSLELQAVYRERADGAPYSIVRRYRDLQDDWNKRRSKSLHLLNTNQVIVEEGVLNPREVAEIRREAAKPDGVLQIPSGVKLSLQKNLDLAQGHVTLMQQTGQAFEDTGPNQALQGQSGSISGIAKQVDTQAGLISIDRPFDSVRHITIRTYRQIWMRIQQFWTEEAWVRVRDDKQIKFVALNREMTRAEALAEELGKMQMPDEEKQLYLAELARNPVYRDRVKLNDVTQMDVDIILDESPNSITVEQQQFEQLVLLATHGVPLPPRALIEASQLRNKEQILEQMEGTNDPAQAAIAQAQKRAADLEEAKKAAEIESLQARSAKDSAAAEESQVDAAMKLAQAGSDAETTVRVT